MPQHQVPCDDFAELVTTYPPQSFVLNVIKENEWRGL